MKTPMGEYVLVRRAVEWTALGTEDEVRRWADANILELRSHVPSEDFLVEPAVRIEAASLSDRIFNPHWPATHKATLAFALVSPGMIPEFGDDGDEEPSVLGVGAAGSGADAASGGSGPRLTVVRGRLS